MFLNMWTKLQKVQSHPERRKIQNSFTQLEYATKGNYESNNSRTRRRQQLTINFAEQNNRIGMRDAQQRTGAGRERQILQSHVRRKWKTTTP